MNKFFLSLFLLISYQTFAQFDYKLFISYSDKITKQRNSKLLNVTEFQQDKNLWVKTSFQQFNLQGLPTTIIQYDQQGKEAQKKRIYL